MMLRVTETGSGLDARFELLEALAPKGCRFLCQTFSSPREIAAIHAIWTGPEISCPVPLTAIPKEMRAPLPPENVTIQPQPGELVLTYLPARYWGGSPDPIFDLGIFYGPGGRMLFPVGWLPGSVVARVVPDQQPHLAEACTAIRRSGACTISFAITPG